MAKNAGSGTTFKKSSKKKRKGVHAKSKTSKTKGSKLYKKRSVGQG